MSDGKAAPAGGAFSALLGELDTMTKAMGGDGDAAIAAAASGTGKSGGENAGGDTLGDKGNKGKSAGGKDDDLELDENGKPIVKSFTAVINGEEVEAVDGTALVKALSDQVESIGAKIIESEDIVAKALGTAVNLIKIQGEKLVEQGNLIKALQGQIGEIGNQGRGRKTLLAIAEKPSVLAKSDDGGMSAQEFMLKANQAFDKKAITGQQFTVIDVSLRSGQPIDESLVTKVLTATSAT